VVAGRAEKSSEEIKRMSAAALAQVIGELIIRTRDRRGMGKVVLPFRPLDG